MTKSLPVLAAALLLSACATQQHQQQAPTEVERQRYVADCSALAVEYRFEMARMNELSGNLQSPQYLASRQRAEAIKRVGEERKCSNMTAFGSEAPKQ